MSEIRILNVKRVERDPIMASFSVSFGPFTANEFKLMRRDNGNAFVSPPQREYTKRDGGRGWVNLVEMTPTELRVLTRRVLAMLGGGGQHGPSGSSGPQSPPQQQGQYPPRQPHPQGYDNDYTAYQEEPDDIPF